MKLEKRLFAALLLVAAIDAAATAQASANPNDQPVADAAPAAPPAAAGGTPEISPAAPAEQPSRSGAAAPPTGSSPAAEPAFGESLARDALVSQVLARNPEARAAQAGWRAALARVPAAAALEYPMVSYSLAPLSIASSDAPFGQELRASQRLPLPGTRRLRREAAAADAAVAEQQLAEVQQRLATMAALLYADLWLVEREREVAREHLRLLETMQRVAASRYAAGLAPQQAPLQAELEAARMEQRLVALAAERRRLAAQVNALLQRPADAPLPPTPVEIDAPTAFAADADAALAARPELRAQQAQVEGQQAALELARRAWRPDVDLMTSYSTMWDMREHRWMVGIGVELPLWGERRRAAIAAAEAELARGAAEVAAREATVREELEIATAGLEESSELLRLYRDRVLPAARDQLAAATAAFQSGASDMLAVVEAERGLRSAQSDYYTAQAEQASRVAELRRALGLTAAATPGAPQPSPSGATTSANDPSPPTPSNPSAAHAPRSSSLPR